MAGFFQANFWNSDGTSSLGIYHETGASRTIQDAVDWAETQSWYPAGAQWSLSVGGPVADYSQPIGDELGTPTDLYQYVEPDYVDHFYLDGDRYNIKAANGVVTSSTAPSNPMEGTLWYDTTNDVLKAYDGSNWNEVGNDSADINTKTFYISSTNDLTNAQAAYDWYLAGKNPIIVYNGKSYTTGSMGAGFMYFYGDTYSENNAADTKMVRYYVYFSLSNDTVTSITVSYTTATNFLSTSRDYSTPYTPQYDGSPATKKYVDDRDTYIGSSAPTSNLVEGRLRYDTTNDQLKVYDGTNWNECGGGTEYTAGTGINIGGLVADVDYHIPTADEYSSLITLLSGMGVSTLADEYLKMPHAGYRDNTGSVVHITGTSSYMCLSTASSQGNSAAVFLFFGQSTPLVTGMGKGYAHPMRLFKNTPVTPDSSWTHTYTYNTDYGIFHSATLGLITVTDGTTLVTMKDKNEGATEVRNDGDTLSIANTGNTFQRGNYYPFPSTLDSTTTINTSAVSVDTTGYGEGVGYYDSTFRTTVSPYDWTDPVSTNLWTKNGNGMAWYTYSENAITNTGVVGVNGQTGNVTVNDFSPTSSGTTGQMLTKTANGYDWGDKPTKVFTITSMSDTTTAQEAYDWWLAGNLPILMYQGASSVYIPMYNTSTYLFFTSAWGGGAVNSGLRFYTDGLYLNRTGDTITSIGYNSNRINVSSSAPAAGTTNATITLVI